MEEPGPAHRQVLQCLCGGKQAQRAGRVGARQRAPPVAIGCGAVVLGFGGGGQVEPGGVGQPECSAALVARGLGQIERLCHQRAALAGGELTKDDGRFADQRGEVQAHLRGCVGAAVQQQFRVEFVAELVAARQQPAVARVRRAGIQREGGGVGGTAELGRKRRRHGACVPKLLPLQHHRALAVFAQHQRVGGDNRAQRAFLEPVGRVETSGHAVAHVDAAEVDDLIVGSRPAEISLAQGVHIPATRHAVAVDRIDPVREHAAQARRQGGIEACVERGSRCVDTLIGSAQAALPASRLDEQAPCLHRFVRGRRRLVGQ